MASHDPAALYCRFIESVVNHRKLDHLGQFLATDVVEHAPRRTVGLAAARQTLAAWLAAFPDLHLLIEDLVVDGDHLMARLTATGTHHGPLASLAGGGFPSHGDPDVAMRTLAPTGARVRLSLFEAWSVPDGHCVERWLQLDRCDLLHQLGLPLADAGGLVNDDQQLSVRATAHIGDSRFDEP
jgi:predicted ester cyclase